MIRWKYRHAVIARRARGVALVLTLFLSACTAPAPPQASFRIPVNLRCTTCNDFLRCAVAGSDVTQAATEISVYRLNEKPFWAQVATIGEYLVQSFRSKVRDERPYTLYRRSAGTWHEIERGSAVIDTVSASIRFSSSSIDQRTGAWQAAGMPGVCEAMPRREGFGLIRQMLGRPLPPHAPVANGKS